MIKGIIESKKATSSSPPVPSYREFMQLYLKLDETTNDSNILVDTVGNKTATAKNTAVTHWDNTATGKINKGIYLKNSGNIEVAHDTSLSASVSDVNQKFSGSFWYQPSTSTPSRNVWHMSKRRLGTNGWQMIYYNGNWHFDVHNSGGSGITNTYTMALNALQWYHVVFTADPETATTKIYINGINVSTLTSIPNYPSPAATNTDPLYIGRFGANTSMYANGIYDEMAFWQGRVLSQSEVTEIYNNGNGLEL
jgi:hypothetical protein